MPEPVFEDTLTRLDLLRRRLNEMPQEFAVAGGDDPDMITFSSLDTAQSFCEKNGGYILRRSVTPWMPVQ